MSDADRRPQPPDPATRAEVLAERLGATEADLAAARAELDAVINSRVWRSWTRFRHGAIGRATARMARVFRRGGGRSSLPQPVGAQPQALRQALDDRLRELGPLPPDSALALYHPQWPGVGHAAVHLFDHAFPLGEDITGQADIAADCLMRTGVRTFVLNGKPRGWDDLAVAIKRRSPEARVLLLWQGTGVQLEPGPVAEEFIGIIELCKAGVIDRLGFGKAGMAEVFARAGIDTRFILNYVRRPPTYPPAPYRDGRTHIGIFFASLEMRKNIYTQLWAAALTPNPMVHMAPSAPSLERIAALINLPYQVVSRHRAPQPPWEHLARMDCNLNIGLSECGPLTPLESLAMGVPCLISSGSHLFRDDDYLHQRLCVEYHDNPQAIADAIVRAVAERDQIVAAYNAYIPGYNARARESVQRFLEPA